MTLDGILSILQFERRDLPVAKEKAKTQIKELMKTQIPEGVDTDKYSFEDSAQDFMLGYVQACIELERKIEAL